MTLSKKDRRHARLIGNDGKAPVRRSKWPGETTKENAADHQWFRSSRRRVTQRLFSQQPVPKYRSSTGSSGSDDSRTGGYRLKSISHEDTLARISLDAAALRMASHPALQVARHSSTKNVIPDSPDLLNSRQLRRRFTRCSYALPENDDGALEGDSDSHQVSVRGSLKNIALASWLNALVVVVPIGYVANYLKWPVVAVFILNFVAIVPLSALMGFATEEVALRLGPTWGGLLSASFGNSVELIMAVIALIQEEYRIVQAGLIGSVLSNTLFVLGWAFLCGGICHRVQLFHAEAAQCAGALLALSVLSMIIPGAYHGVHASKGEITNGILVMSRGTALVLLVVYILFLVFQLKTHSDLFDGSLTHHTHQKKDTTEHQQGETVYHHQHLVLDMSAVDDKGKAAFPGLNHSSHMSVETQNSDRHHTAPQMKLWIATTLLVLVCGLLALSADILVESVDSLTSQFNISHTFVGMILLPIAANAAEHTMSVTVAIRNKMDLCITAAVGSSMQMTLFVLPVLIIISWMLSKPLTLFFDDFETTTMLICVLVINYLIMNGRSNWLKGAMLLSSYLIVALAFFLYPAEVDDPHATITAAPREKSRLLLYN
ncbi:hypothetical protein GGI12_000106 [Dipsacomyces acuminosporus]|nr:hypothetical protein GGI12_000106 [Dipsacomyces acuminosporus]